MLCKKAGGHKVAPTRELSLLVARESISGHQIWGQGEALRCPDREWWFIIGRMVLVSCVKRMENLTQGSPVAMMRRESPL